MIFLLKGNQRYCSAFRVLLQALHTQVYVPEYAGHFPRVRRGIRHKKAACACPHRVNVSKKSACGVLFRVLTLFPSRPHGAPGRETAQGTLAQQGFRIRRTCRRIRIAFGGLRPSKPPKEFFLTICALCARPHMQGGQGVYRAMGSFTFRRAAPCAGGGARRA